MSRRTVSLPVFGVVVVALVFGAGSVSNAAPQPPTPSVAAVAAFPGSPSPAAAFDWKQRALDYDAYVYDWNHAGCPTIQLDTTHHNMATNSYKMPTYLCDGRLATDGYQEGVNQITSAVSGSLVGVNKASQGGFNYVDMLRNFYHGTQGIVMNGPIDPQVTEPGCPTTPAHSTSWWYTTTPNVLYFMLGTQYPNETNMTAMMRSIADKYYDAVVALGGANANFNQQGFNFTTMQPYSCTRNEGGDGANGTAAILLWAYEKFGDAKYLQGSKWAMDFLERSNGHMYLESLSILGPYVAARLNAEYGTTYDVSRMFGTILSGSTTRPGWGTMQTSWNGYDVYGLQGSTNDTGNQGQNPPGYAFAGNSYFSAMLAGTAKYDPRYADTVGRFLLNVSNAARFFYPDQLPAGNQVYGSTYINDPAHVISYEGLRNGESGQSPRGTGDPHVYCVQWGISCNTKDLALYGASWVGFLGATVAQTNVANVLRIDLNALDFQGNNTYPTYLYYNPTGSPANVQLPVTGTKSLYDSVSDTLLTASVSGTATVVVPPGSSRIVTVAPANPTLTRSSGKTSLNGTVVGWHSGNPDLAYGHTVTASTTVNNNLPSYITDGTTARRWESQTADPQWVTVDLGQNTTVDNVVLRWETASAKSFKVQVSIDNSTWSDVYTTTTGPGGVQNITFNPVTARYVRVYMTQRNTAFAYSIYDLEVYHHDLAASAPIVASSTANGNLGSYLTDGTTATRWESQASDPQGVMVDLGQSSTVARLVLKWETASAKSFQVSVSTDGTNYSQVYSTTSGPGGTQVVTFSSTTARYIWINMTQRNTPWAYSMYDLEVYAQ